MITSERSSLLPSRAKPLPNTCRPSRSVFQICFVVAVLCALMVSVLILRLRAESMEAIDHSYMSVDAQISIWDSIKEELGPAESKTQQFETATAEEMAKIWNITEDDAVVFKNTVASWWEDDAVPSEKSIQQNFETWWISASAAEKSWWGKLVSTLKHDEEETGHWLSKEGHDIAQSTKNLWNTTEHEASKDWKATETTAGRDWEATKEATKHGEESAATWIENTETEFSKDEKAVDKTIANWWHATSDAIHEDWDKSVVDAEQWWNVTRAWFTNQVESTHRPILYLNSSRAYYLLSNGEGWFDYSKDYFTVRPDTQINQAFCGVATAAAILNSIPSSITTPDPVYYPYLFVTQTSILKSDCVNDKVVKYSKHYNGILHPPGGLSLSQVGKLLECNLDRHEFDVLVEEVDGRSSLDEVREALRTAMLDSNVRVLVNFDRKSLGQYGAGHFSPIVAYNQHEDMVLINDVAKYKYPPVWVSTARLFDAMNTVDSCGDYRYPAEEIPMPNSTAEFKHIYKELDCRETHRGYIVVSKRD